jgi:hypothetical protein
MERNTVFKNNQQIDALRRKQPAEKYTNVHGSYWKRNVNLAPPNFVERTPETDKDIYSYHDTLQYYMYETNYPETEDRTMNPRTYPPETGISIVILSPPEKCLAILLEGGSKMSR